MKLRHWWQEILLAAVAVLTVVLTSFLIVSSLRLHKVDLQWQLQKSEFLDCDISKMYMLARFTDQYKLYQQVITHQDVDEHEYAISVLFDAKPQAVWGEGNAWDAIDFVSLQVINVLRRASGQPILANPVEGQAISSLEQAFFLERAHEYGEALRVLEPLGAVTTDYRLLGIINLHKGFCQALSGEVDIARQSYLKVISNHRDDDLGVTASLLLRHLEVILQERAMLLRTNLDDLTRARKMAVLWQCREVLSSFDPNSVQSPEVKAEFLTLRARCQEEIGDQNGAVENYTKAISVAGNSKVARDANRRLFVLGGLVKGGERIQKASLHMNETLKDSSLMRMQQMHLENPEVHLLDTQSLQSKILDQLDIAAQHLKNVVAQKPHLAVLIKREPLVDNHVQTSLPFPPAGTSVRIELQSGKSFIGRLLSEPSDEDVRIQAMIGVITVKRAEVSSVISQ